MTDMDLSLFVHPPPPPLMKIFLPDPALDEGFFPSQPFRKRTNRHAIDGDFDDSHPFFDMDLILFLSYFSYEDSYLSSSSSFDPSRARSLIFSGSNWEVEDAKEKLNKIKLDLKEVKSREEEDRRM